jgi:uncharacterized protein
MPTKIRVLSIDGGGTRGLFPATILQLLEEAQNDKPISEMFDVIVGSATGGIIVTALAAGMKACEISKIYNDEAKIILPRPFLRHWWNCIGLFVPKYPNKNLKSLLEKKFKDKTLAKAPKTTTFLIPTLELSPKLNPGDMKEFKVVIYNNQKEAYQDETLLDIAMRTSAAVVTLPIYQGFIEGGNYANDPALIGLSYCLGKPGGENGGLGLSLNDFTLLSIGCGSSGDTFFEHKKIFKGNWGLFRWIVKLKPLVIDAKMKATQYYAKQMLGDNYLRIDFDYTSPDAPQELEGKKLAVDVRDKELLDAIRKCAEITFEKKGNDIEKFIKLTP